MKSIAIITTPLQLLNLSEYLFHFPIDNLEIIALLKRDNSLKQIEQISAHLDLKIKTIAFFDKGLHFLKLRSISKTNKTVDRLILGQFFSDPLIYFSNKVNYRELIILDDGLANVHVKDAVENRTSVIKQNNLKKLIKAILGINTNFPHEVTLFTLFDITSSKRVKVIKNSLAQTKLNIGLKSLSDEVLIIGQPFIETGEVEKQSYLKLLQDIANENSSCEKIIYLSHRRERDNTLDEVRKIPKLEVVQSAYNFELYLSLRSLLPQKIVGFSSTALITSKLLTGNNKEIEITSYKLPPNLILQNKEKIYSCYTQIEQTGVQTKQLML